MIYGLGLPKTGTTSLVAALKALGLRQRVDFHVGDYVFFMDKPENGKFILTVRDPDVWFDSIYRWSRRPGLVNSAAILNQRQKMYGHKMPTIENRQDFIDRYNEYNKNAIERYRPLIVNWENGDGWEQLCKYLGTSVPNRQFPFLNKNNNN